MARGANNTAANRLLTLATIALVVTMLYMAQAILLPVALAVLFSFLLSPAVSRLERLGLGRIPSVASVVGVTFALLVGLIVLFSTQLVQLTYQLPQYRENLEAKVDTIGPMIGRALSTFKQFTGGLIEVPVSKPAADSGENEAPATTASHEGSTPPADAPATLEARGEAVPVKVVETATSPLAILRDWLGPVVSPLATALVVTVFVVFMLIEREDLRNRAIVLLGERKLRETTQLFDEAAQRVGRYLRMQVLVNLGYGLSVGIGLALLGMPNAPFWGLMSCLSRFVPYVGTFVGAAVPIALSFLVFDGWGYPLAILAMYLALEFIGSNVVEPWLFGASTGLSSLGVILSAFFWTWLWGTVGLILAVPLTVCLTAWGRYVPQLRFLNVLLSDQPVLAPASRVYQRLLAYDLDEAQELVEEYGQSHSLVEVCDDVLLPTLVLVERDRHENSLEPEAQAFVLRSLRDIVEDLPDLSVSKVQSQRAADAPEAEPVEIQREAPRILCMPARDEADEIAAEMVSHVWRKMGHKAEVAVANSLMGERIEAADKGEFDAILVSAVPPFAVLHARYLCKRLRPRLPEKKIVVGLWQTGDSARSKARLEQAGFDKVTITIAQAIEQLEHLATSAASTRSRQMREDPPQTTPNAPSATHVAVHAEAIPT